MQFPNIENLIQLIASASEQLNIQTNSLINAVRDIALTINDDRIATNKLFQLFQELASSTHMKHLYDIEVIIDGQIFSPGKFQEFDEIVPFLKETLDQKTDLNNAMKTTLLLDICDIDKRFEHYIGSLKDDNRDEFLIYSVATSDVAVKLYEIFDFARQRYDINLEYAVDEFIQTHSDCPLPRKMIRELMRYTNETDVQEKTRAILYDIFVQAHEAMSELHEEDLS